jgi:hypothetical protein
MCLPQNYPSAPIRVALETLGTLFLGGFVGVFAFSWVVGAIDSHYHLSSSCMPVWIYYSVPVGALMGGLSACILRLFARGEWRKAAFTAPAFALLVSPFAFLHLRGLVDALRPHADSVTTGLLVQQLPFLMWWGLLLAAGFAAHRLRLTEPE